MSTAPKIKLLTELVKIMTVILSLLLLSAEAEGAFELLTDDIVALSMGGSGCASVFSESVMGMNPAVSAFYPGLMINLIHRKLYNMEQLQQNQADIYFGISEFGLGIKFYDFGWEYYRENVFGLSFSQALSHKVTLGIRGSYYHIRINDYDKANAYGIDFGGIFRILDNLSLGCYADNINRPVLDDSDEKIPTSIVGGLAYSPGKDFEFCLDFYKEEDFPPEIRSGVAYYGLKSIYLRAGASNQPAKISAGLEVPFNFVNIRYSVYTHNQLGLTHVFGVLIILK